MNIDVAGVSVIDEKSGLRLVNASSKRLMLSRVELVARDSASDDQTRPPSEPSQQADQEHPQPAEAQDMAVDETNIEAAP